MARPRIFVSSTYYDLKHIRSSLELFIESVGYDPVLSEKGDIAYTPDQALDESCYREAASCDIFVMVIGGRYGSEASSDRKRADRKFFERYDSITRKEFESAYDSDVPTFILVESGVYSEYQTYLKNKGNKTVRYAHVDSANIFLLIDDLISKPRNNPISTFEKSTQIEAWLREQWAGLFRELLKSRSQQKQLLALTGQVSELKTVNDTLKTYLEEVLRETSPKKSNQLIEKEERRLEEHRMYEFMKENRWYSFMIDELGTSDNLALGIIAQPKTPEELLSIIEDSPSRRQAGISIVLDAIRENEEAQRDFNEARRILGLEHIDFSSLKKPSARPRRRLPVKETAPQADE